MRKVSSGRTGGILARTLWLAALAGLAAAPGAEPAAAQEERGECRCVDASGEEIERCACFRLPGMDFARGVGWTFERPRARIGVSVGGDAGGEEERRGVLLRDVVEGSPADEAGLRPGDVVTRVDGRSVLEPLEDEEERTLEPEAMVVQRFIRLVGRLEPGEEATLEYIRDDETRAATVVPERSRGFYGAVTPESGFYFRDAPGRDFELFTPEGLQGRVFSFDPEERGLVFGREGERSVGVWGLGEGDGGVRVLGSGLDPCFTSRSGGALTVIAGSRCVDGLHLQDLGPQLAEYFGVEEGVLVVEVDDEAALGLRAGDVIRSIDGREVADVADVRRILRSYEEDEPVELTVVRRGETRAVRGTRR